MDWQHERMVGELAKKIARLDCPFRIYHGSTCSTRYSGRRRDEVVDVGELDRVLVDPGQGVAIAETCCTMEKLVRAAIPHGLVPPVVPEFPNITVGGAFAGTAGESSSFNYGLFHATVERIEVILANGDVVYASREEKEDLFAGAAGTLGSLGVVTLLHIRLRKARDFVRLTLSPVVAADLVRRVDQAMDSQIDFVEAIMFDKDSGAMITGSMTDERTGPCVRFSRAWDPWFYVFARRARNEEMNACTPLVDYLFRYDRGAFWTGRLAFRYFLAPFNRLTRFVFDPLMRTKVLYRALHGSGLSRRYVVQDIAVPSRQVQKFLSVIDQELAISPLWICPLKVGPIGLMPRTFDPNETQILYNIGIWGPGSTHFPTFCEQNRTLERQARLHDGCKWPYAMHFHPDEDDFWEDYRYEEYKLLRKKYVAQRLPTVFGKMTQDMDKLYSGPKGLWPLQGLWGIWSAVFMPKLRLL